MSRRWLSAAVLVLLVATPPATAASYTVAAGDPPTALADALEQARPGDEIVVRSGVWTGPFVVTKPLRLRGEGWPVLDGGGDGTVLAVRAVDVTLEGFVIRGSGRSLDQENSGVALDGAARGRIIGNRLDDVLFGIYLRQSPASVIRGNRIRGKRLDLPRRGDAVRVWSSDGVRVEDNKIEDSRDVVLWYSAGLVVRGNRVASGRYGLHFMYCDDAAITENLLLDNSVGAFLMYSRRLRLERNTIAGNHGPSGYGVGLKDMDDAVVRANVFAGNRVGAFLDNTPREMRSQSRIEDNLFAANDVGLVLLPNVRRGQLLGNSFVENPQQVSIEGGGGDPEANRWHGNYWSDYSGYDADGDGTGDVPYRLERLFDNLSDRHPALRLFLHGPATRAVDLAARAFPLVRPEPRLVDVAPRMRPHRPEGPPALGEVGDPRLVPLGGGLVVGALLVIFAPGFLLRVQRRLGQDDELHAAAGDATAADTVADDTEVLLEARALSRRFGEQLALDGVSFAIRRGESVAIWGPNGAGKTTALRALLGVIPVDGTVRVAGVDPWRRGKSARARMGFVPQDVRFQDDLGVAETLDFYARLRRAPAGRGERLLARLGLENEVDKRVGELSGGLRQRLALGVALLADPPILLLDEPTANLDARARADFLELLRELKAAGKTLVFSSHRPEEVFALADRVLHLEAGRLRAEGPPSRQILDLHRDAELWLRVGEDEHPRAAAVLAAGGFETRRLGPHLVVTVAAERKIEPLAALFAADVEVEDFALDAAGGRSSSQKGGA